jgi:mono/diheme cytochrome c family protein
MFRPYFLGTILTIFAVPAWADGSPAAGKELVLQSCTTCHATEKSRTVADAAPPLSQIARDNRANGTWIHAWLSNPHRAMAGIMLSRQQIADVIAYLSPLERNGSTHE